MSKNKRQDYKMITVGELQYPAVAEFIVPRVGWELDNTGFVIVKDGQHAFVLTNHGKPHLARPQEIAAIKADLIDAIDSITAAEIKFQEQPK